MCGWELIRWALNVVAECKNCEFRDERVVPKAAKGTFFPQGEQEGIEC